jgi:hypothetical protein
MPLCTTGQPAGSALPISSHLIQQLVCQRMTQLHTEYCPI